MCHQQEIELARRKDAEGGGNAWIGDGHIRIRGQVTAGIGPLKVIITTNAWAERREHADALQVVQPGRHKRLLPKIHVHAEYGECAWLPQVVKQGSHNRLLPKIYCSPQYRACLAAAGGAAGQAQPAAAQDLRQPGHHTGGRRAPARRLRQLQVELSHLLSVSEHVQLPKSLHVHPSLSIHQKETAGLSAGQQSALLTAATFGMSTHIVRKTSYCA